MECADTIYRRLEESAWAVSHSMNGIAGRVHGSEIREPWLAESGIDGRQAQKVR